MLQMKKLNKRHPEFNLTEAQKTELRLLVKRSKKANRDVKNSNAEFIRFNDRINKIEAEFILTLPEERRNLSRTNNIKHPVPSQCDLKHEPHCVSPLAAALSEKNPEQVFIYDQGVLKNALGETLEELSSRKKKESQKLVKTTSKEVKNKIYLNKPEVFVVKRKGMQKL